MRNSGGTPYSIIRAMFVYWDADKSGMICDNELLSCMKSLGVKVTLKDCQDIVSYYQSKLSRNGKIEMNYQDFLKDLVKGEPTIIEYVTSKDEKDRNDTNIRFEDETDAFSHKPAIVNTFIEAVRHYIMIKMRTVGGTPQQHVRFLFQFYDYDFSGIFILNNNIFLI